MTYTKGAAKTKKRKRTEPLTPEEKADRRQRKAMKQRAAILSITPLGNNRFQVWGGENPHVVTVSIDGDMFCDCEGWKHARHNNCSHVMKYRLVYGDLKKVGK